MKKIIDVLYVHPLIDKEDKRIPMGIIGLMNSLDCRKRGVYSNNLSKKLILSTKIVVMDLHWFFHLRSVEAIAKRIKLIDKSIEIIVGGYTATIFAEIIINKFGIDYVIVGDSEKPFNLLIKNLLNKTSLKLVPNIMTKEFKTKKDYSLTQKDFNSIDNISIGWFPDYKKNIEKKQKKDNQIPFIFVPIIRGCYYSCDWCYGNIKNQQILCNRKAVIRDAEYIKRDLTRCSDDSSIKKISIIGDFIDLYNVGLIDSKYVSTILSKKYDLEIYYEFFNLPSIEQLEKLIKCFKKITITISFLKNHGQSFEFNDYAKLKEISEFLNNKQNVKLIMYGDPTNYLIEVYGNFLKKKNPRIITNNDSDWRMLVPSPNSNKKGNINQFKLFYSITKWDKNINFS